MPPRSFMRFVVSAVLLVAVAAAVFGYIAGSAPAGNRDPSATFTFDAFPGPSSVTIGKDVVYKGTYSNPTKSQWLNVTFSQLVPYANIKTGDVTSKLPAKLVYSSCATDPYNPPAVAGDRYSCPTIAVLPANSAIQKVTLAWESQALPEGATCVDPCQLTTRAVLSIKEANPGSNDTFFNPPLNKDPIVTTLLQVPDPKAAGGYALKACTGPSNPTLFTNKTLSDTNKGYTSVCVPVVPGQQYDPGSVVTINEFDDTNPDDPGFTQIHQVCIAATGLTCPNDANPQQFPIVPVDNRPTFSFVFDNKAYKGRPITQMFHEVHTGLGSPFWEPVSTNPAANYYCNAPVVDNTAKTTTFTCQGITNSHWRGG